MTSACHATLWEYCGLAICRPAPRRQDDPTASPSPPASSWKHITRTAALVSDLTGTIALTIVTNRGGGTLPDTRREDVQGNVTVSIAAGTGTGGGAPGHEDRRRAFSINSASPQRLLPGDDELLNE